MYFGIGGTVKYLLIAFILYSPLTLAKRFVKKPMWVMCKVNYKEKGSYQSLFKVYAYDTKYIYVGSNGKILEDGKGIVNKIPLEDCLVL